MLELNAISVAAEAVARCVVGAPVREMRVAPDAAVLPRDFAARLSPTRAGAVLAAPRVALRLARGTLRGDADAAVSRAAALAELIVRAHWGSVVRARAWLLRCLVLTDEPMREALRVADLEPLVTPLKHVEQLVATAGRDADALSQHALRVLILRGARAERRAGLRELARELEGAGSFLPGAAR